MKALRIKDVVAKVALSQSSIYALVAAGEFPKPFQLTANRVAWLEQDVDDWLSAKAGRAPERAKEGSTQQQG
ncbi:AlpA family transcriptional regulator [Burkholderia plantarii]|uniref:helix-turn-helix transcriptional regulator n=1 Tax=Burkholderia plantarii TaxID=41899 RepID=UPI00272BC7B2|nr:AlpA family phage regulatory protein [Burkholderia plantarii]WLE58353.1 AlpA family transcriptional regulator [Burkholderia plantarii]